MPEAPLKIETKQVKHTFTLEERDAIGGDLSRAIAGLRGIEAEFDQAKAGFKARITEAEAKIDCLSTSRMNGFDMRNERCTVVYRPKDREKDFYLESDARTLPPETVQISGLAASLAAIGILPALTEPMTPADFEQELIQAESLFENREEIDLFTRTETDFGTLVVGRLAGKWYSALRVKVGAAKLDERLDSEQRCFKARADAVRHAVKRVSEWAKENLKDAAKGFEDSFKAVVEAHKERAE